MGTRLLRLLRYYGVKGFMKKAWEKTVVDSRRFRGERMGNPPVFPETDLLKLPETAEKTGQGGCPILYIVHWFFPEKQGGTERFVLTQAKEQLRRGNRVRVLTLTVDRSPTSRKTPDGFWVDSYEYQGVPVTAFCYERAPLGLYYKRIDDRDPIMYQFALEQIRTFKPAVVHCAYAQPMAAFLRACRDRDVPYVITLTGFDSLCHYTTMLDKQGRLCSGCQRGTKCRQRCKTYGIADYEERYRTAETYLRKAAAVAAPSQYVANVIAAEFPGQSLYVIPHGVTFGADAFRLRTEAPRRFLYLGTLTELKGIPLLIRSFIRFRRNAELRIYGAGGQGYTRFLQRLASGDDRIAFMGALPPDCVREAYEWADCVVVPSLVPETYNFVIREALAHGCLVIGSCLGALTEVVLPGRNGFLFTPEDPNGLLGALECAASFRWANYERKQFPTPQEEADTYLSLYRSLQKQEI